MNIFRYILMIGLWPLLLSCVADSDIRAESDEPAKVEKLKKVIVGKWEFGDKILKVLGGKSSIEFSDVGTYVLHLASEKIMISGDYDVLSSAEIGLDNFGHITEIAEENGTMTFDLKTADQTYEVVANKVEALDDLGKTQLLCRKWQMTREENGADTLNVVAKSFITFSNNGIIVIEAYTFGWKSPATSVMKWRWDDANENKIPYSSFFEDISQGKYFYMIRELTESKLKLTETNYWGESNYVFEPAVE